VGTRSAQCQCLSECHKARTAAVQVGDPFTAVALKGLLEVLLASGCCVVATSNRAPAELPAAGVHEALFEHFVGSIEAACDVVCLDSGRDYRRLLPAAGVGPALQQHSSDTADGVKAGVGGAQAAPASGAAAAGRLYLWPLSPASDAAMLRLWEHQQAQPVPAAAARAQGSTAQAESPAEELPVMFGRSLAVPRRRGGAAWFEFEELCARPLGAADYIALSHAFHTIFVANVPLMSMQARRGARFLLIPLASGSHAADGWVVGTCEGPPVAHALPPHPPPPPVGARPGSQVHHPGGRALQPQGGKKAWQGGNAGQAALPNLCNMRMCSRRQAAAAAWGGRVGKAPCGEQAGSATACTATQPTPAGGRRSAWCAAQQRRRTSCLLAPWARSPSSTSSSCR
jgi:hypothetical protein